MGLHSDIFSVELYPTPKSLWSLGDFGHPNKDMAVQSTNKLLHRFK